MPVYNGSTKQGTLYYGGSKIKEAYYGSTKVYSSGPLYYCYRNNYGSGYNYRYYMTYPVVGLNNGYIYEQGYYNIQASSSSQLNKTVQDNITEVSSNSIKIFVSSYNITTEWERFANGDLYT